MQRYPANLLNSQGVNPPPDQASAAENANAAVAQAISTSDAQPSGAQANVLELHDSPLISSHLPIKPEKKIPLRFLVQTDNALANFLLGHRPLQGDDFGAAQGKFALELMDDAHFGRTDLHKLRLMEQFFPIEHSSVSGDNAPTADIASRNCFRRNPALRAIHRKAADRAMDFFGFERPSSGKNVKQVDDFATRQDLWYRDTGTEGALQREFLFRLIRSLYMHSNEEIAVNLFIKARGMIAYSGLTEEAQILDTVFSDIPICSQQAFFPFEDPPIKLTERPLTLKEKRAGKVLAKSIREKMERVQNKAPDALGNKIFKTWIKHNKYEFFYNENKYLGCIDYTKDTLSKTQFEGEGKHKSITHFGKKAVLFNTTKPPMEPKQANKLSHLFDDCKHIFPAFYLSNSRMVSSFAGSINGNDERNNGRKVPRHAFRGLLSDLDNLHSQNVFVCDIKPSNLVLMKNTQGKVRHVNLIDVDSGVITEPKTVDLEKDFFYTREYMHSTIYQGLMSQPQRQNSEMAKLLRQHNYYCLLLSMYFMTELIDADIHELYKNYRKIRSHQPILDQWLTGIATSPQNANKLKAFMHDPAGVDLDIYALDSLIRWESLQF